MGFATIRNVAIGLALPHALISALAATLFGAPAFAQGVPQVFTNPIYLGNDRVSDVATADFEGNGVAPIPNFPALVGAQVAFQAFWVFGPAESCDPSPLGLSSSPGMALTIQP